MHLVMKQIILLVLLFISSMSGFVAENSEGAYTCSKSIHDYLVKQNVTDANLIRLVSCYILKGV